MIPRLVSTLAAAAISASASSQLAINTVGFTFDGGPIQIGSICDPFSCTPARTGVARGFAAPFGVFGRPGSPFVIAAGTPAPCRFVPGVAHAIMMAPPITTLAIGFLSPNPGTICQQGSATVILPIPQTAPPGLTVSLQAVALETGIITDMPIPGFSNAIEVTF